MRILSIRFRPEWRNGRRAGLKILGGLTTLHLIFNELHTRDTPDFAKTLPVHLYSLAAGRRGTTFMVMNRRAFCNAASFSAASFMSLSSNKDELAKFWQSQGYLV